MIRLVSFLLFLTNIPALSQNQVSPDGSKIVDYEEYPDGQTEIVIIDSDGTNKVRLTSHPYSDYNPSWSSDGRKVYFYRKHPTESLADIFVRSLDDSVEKQITFSKSYEADPAPSPDNRRIAYNSKKDGDFEIFVMNADGTSPKQLTSNEANDWSANWSPDGSRIAFVSDRSGSFEVYTMDSDGQQEKQLTSTQQENYKPSWSPDGTRIAFFHRSSEKEKFDIYMINPDGSEPRNLTNTPEWNEFIMGWNHDSAEIVFSSEKENAVCSTNVASIEKKVWFRKVK